jgi:sulfide dehydrogenase cytochrome subunit
LAAPCSACHGPNGASPGAIPSLNQLDAAAMTERLKSFKSGEIQATVMNRIAKGYSDEEIAALSQYFSTLKR